MDSLGISVSSDWVARDSVSMSKNFNYFLFLALEHQLSNQLNKICKKGNDVIATSNTHIYCHIQPIDVVREVGILAKKIHINKA